MKILFKKLCEKATIPTVATGGSAGFDLYANEPVMIGAGERKLIKTGIAMAIPEGYHAKIHPRSGIASKKKVDTKAGLIDSDYRGEIMVLLENNSKINFGISEGNRIAQLVVSVNFNDWHEVDELPETIRGEGGFGSTGK